MPMISTFLLEQKWLATFKVHIYKCSN